MRPVLGTLGRVGTHQEESGTPIGRLGAERSQVQILSPRSSRVGLRAGVNRRVVLPLSGRLGSPASAREFDHLLVEREHVAADAVFGPVDRCQACY